MKNHYVFTKRISCQSRYPRARLVVRSEKKRGIDERRQHIRYCRSARCLYQFDEAWWIVRRLVCKKIYIRGINYHRIVSSASALETPDTFRLTCRLNIWRPRSAFYLTVRCTIIENTLAPRARFGQGEMYSVRRDYYREHTDLNSSARDRGDRLK